MSKERRFKSSSPSMYPNFNRSDLVEKATNYIENTYNISKGTAMHDIAIEMYIAGVYAGKKITKDINGLK